MRILGIPVRGKAMWIVLAVIAAAVIGLVIYAKLGGEKETVEDRPQTFTQRAEPQSVEPEPEESTSAIDFAARAEEKLRQEQSGQEAGAEPEADQTSESEPESEPEPEPEPESEPEPEPESVPLPYIDSLGVPAAEDFAWIPDVQTGDLTGSFLGNDELIGKWKGEIIYDGIWELVYVTIDTSGSITIEPYQINYGDGWEDETGGEPYLFDGTFDISSVYGSGSYGSISLYTFLESYGTQYGVGTFSVHDESSADVYMVRP